VIWLWVVVLVVVLGAVAILAAGRDDAMGEVYDDRPDRGIPTGRPLTADDLDAVRLSTAVRGYRMDEVDALIDRLRADLIARERHEEASGHEVPAIVDNAHDDPSPAPADESPERPIEDPAPTGDDAR
jgi:DivIVA domain-containing protein